VEVLIFGLRFATQVSSSWHGLRPIRQNAGVLSAAKCNDTPREPGCSGASARFVERVFAVQAAYAFRDKIQVK
jgi:hypothetical protein